jgi:DNA repair protein RadA/Sms
MIAKAHPSSYRCGDCGHNSSKWFGRCPRCGSWNTESESAAPVSQISSLGPAAQPPGRIETGIAELDRVLGGGFVAGEVVLVAGEPGIGKSTLVLQLLDALGGSGRKTLLVTGEESPAQVALRASRLGVDGERIRATSQTAVEQIIDGSEQEGAEVVVVDSIQTVATSGLDHAAGSLLQLRDCTAELGRYAKSSGAVVVVVGHVTKDGAIAGPKSLEHMVDAVLSLEGERTTSLRLLRAVKNRFGSCEETGVFVMGRRGLEAVMDPSAMLLADRRAAGTGSVVFPALEGSRCVLIEMQALVAPTTLPQPRRVAQGLEPRRLALLLGVTSKHLKLRLGSHDVFASAAGGIAVREPAADLAVLLALTSAAADVPVDAGLVAVGEIGLSGEVRRVPGVERRLAEASRLGFRSALVPRGCADVPSGLEPVVVDDVAAAVAHMSARAHSGERRSPVLEEVTSRAAG